MFDEWGWREWLAAIAIFVLLLDIHKRASRAMDATDRIERHLNDLRIPRSRDDWAD